MAELRQNTWTLDQWYDQDVAGNANYSRLTGSLWAWGNNDRGQLGQNDRTKRSSPTQIPGSNWDVLAAGKFNVECAIHPNMLLEVTVN